jgi:hypothetical protein
MVLADIVWDAIRAIFPWIVAAIAACYLAGLVAHWAGWPTRPFWAAMALMLGFAMGVPLPWVLGMIDGSTPAGAGLSVLLAVTSLTVILVGLAFGGRLRTAGLVLAGATVPTLGYMGAALIDDLVEDGGTTLTLGATVAVSAIALLAGVALAIHGDANPMPDPAAKAGRPGSHRGGSLTAALMRQATYGFVPPRVLFPFAGAALGSVVGGGEPALSVVACIAGATTGAAVGTEVEVRWIPARPRLAFEGMAWPGLRDIERFQRLTGIPLPVTPTTIDAWLATPGTDADAPYRVELLAWRGRVDEARRIAAGLPADTPVDAFRREIALIEVEWRAGSRPDLAPLRRLAATIEPADSDERRMAEGQLATAESEHLLGNLDPAWIEPLLAFRLTLPPDVAGLHGRSMRRKVRYEAIGSAVVAAITTTITSIGAS